MMSLPRRQNSIVLALCANAILLLAILVVLLTRGGSGNFLPIAFAQEAGKMPLAPQPIAGGGGMYLMPAQFSLNTWGCYIMDIDQQTLTAYQYLPGDGRTLKLVAARSFRYDRRLHNYNTTPDPVEIRKLVEQQDRDARQREAGESGDAQ